MEYDMKVEEGKLTHLPIMDCAQGDEETVLGHLKWYA